MGYGSKRLTIAPLLTARHRAQRLTWAREVANWTLEDLKHVAWSDESRYRLFRADGRVRVWRKPNKAMDSICQQGTVQAGGGSVMMWDVFTCHGLGPFVNVLPKFNGNRYKTLLGDHLQPSMDFSFPDNDGIFQQDNAPSLRAVDVRDWFEEHSGEFQRMEDRYHLNMQPVPTCHLATAQTGPPSSSQHWLLWQPSPPPFIHHQLIPATREFSSNEVGHCAAKCDMPFHSHPRHLGTGSLRVRAELIHVADGAARLRSMILLEICDSEQLFLNSEIENLRACLSWPRERPLVLSQPRHYDHRNAWPGETGGPQENPPTSGIVRHDSHLRKFGSDRAGIERGSRWWEASGLTAQPPWLHIKLGTSPLIRTIFELSLLLRLMQGPVNKRIAEEKREGRRQPTVITDAVMLQHKRLPEAAVSERLACSPPIKANRLQSPAGSLPDFRMWESCRTNPLVVGVSRGFPLFRTMWEALREAVLPHCVAGICDRASSSPSCETLQVPSTQQRRVEDRLWRVVWIRTFLKQASHHARRVPNLHEMPTLHENFLHKFVCKAHLARNEEKEAAGCKAQNLGREIGVAPCRSQSRGCCR
ncbi:hypothetical protein PR048_028028 [Dryococelus australis]|uniref:Uncharacterized protein n=1 Tax=Dryococelus australis TaxID=614101 RepID=A0ABQ9GI32_9NEOP|nr:hypothetical protein PR048_028028 [Dryococelus australis]